MTAATLTLTLDVSARPAERLRVRKGELLRVTSFAGEVTEYRVTKVSMPDAFGRCVVSAEPHLPAP